LADRSLPSPQPASQNLGIGALNETPSDEGLSLDKLNQAFAEMLGGGYDPYSDAPETEIGAESSVTEVRTPSVAVPSAAAPTDVDAACEITPRNILEAMLFVGNRENQPLTNATVAKLMRGVRPAEVDELVRELNEQYRANNCPYEIASEGDGYRMRLREQLSGVRDKFYGRVRQARLSSAAVEVLALVAYKGPISGDDVSKMRGTPSAALLRQLVRRQLLAIDRPDDNPRKPLYRTTNRFLHLFGLESLDDLPRSQDLG
jgi:segregation and condensation protein B